MTLGKSSWSFLNYNIMLHTRGDEHVHKIVLRLSPALPWPLSFILMYRILPTSDNITPRSMYFGCVVLNVVYTYLLSTVKRELRNFHA